MPRETQGPSGPSSQDGEGNVSHVYNKVIFGGKTLIDLSQDTVTSNRLLKGFTAHDSNGLPIVGSYESSGSGPNGLWRSAIASYEIIHTYDAEVSIVIPEFAPKVSASAVLK